MPDDPQQPRPVIEYRKPAAKKNRWRLVSLAVMIGGGAMFLAQFYFEPLSDVERTIVIYGFVIMLIGGIGLLMNVGRRNGH